MSDAPQTCPKCGLPGIEMTVHGDTAQKFTCRAGHRWEMREATEEELELMAVDIEPLDMNWF